MVSLSFVLAPPILWNAVFCLALNSSENRLKDFHALGLLVFYYFMTYIGIFSVSPSGVETMASSSMALYCL